MGKPTDTQAYSRKLIHACSATIRKKAISLRREHRQYVLVKNVILRQKKIVAQIDAAMPPFSARQRGAPVLKNVLDILRQKKIVAEIDAA